MLEEELEELANSVWPVQLVLVKVHSHTVT